MSVSDDFAAAISAHGWIVKSIIQDGLYHRFDIKKPRDNAGYYNLDAEGHGVFGSWKTSEQFRFRPDRIDKMTEQERQEQHARMKAQAVKRAEDTENGYRQAAAKAIGIWNRSQPAPDDYPYAVKKNIKPLHVRVTPDGKLVVPLYDDKDFVNVQLIEPSGKPKKFLYGGKKKGCWFEIPGDDAVVYICEGYATAVTVNAATGHTAIVAFDAGNMVAVAPRIRKKFGIDAHIIVAGDNDTETEGNPGATAAKTAADKIDAAWIIPEGITGSDWNDHAAERGMEATTLALLPTDEPDDDEPDPAPAAPPARQKVQLPISLDVDEKGRPKGTLENLDALIKNAGINLRYNVISKQLDFIIPDKSYSIDNRGNASLAHILSLCKQHGMSTSHIAPYLINLCDQNLFNPVATWILSKPWDGVSRLNEFYGTVTAEGEADNPTILDLKELKLKRWMISAVAAIFEPNGVSARGVLVFQGDQYIGKTSWIKKLAPQHLDVIKDGALLKVDDKDSVFQCVSHWIVELGELDATFRKSDIAQIKAFIPQQRDIIRRPFDPKESFFARRTVFCASVNPKNFLHDETGNTRFWIIACERLQYDHTLDMQQIWAEFYAMYRKGERWIMTNQEIQGINQENSDFEAINSIEERVQRAYDWSQLPFMDLSSKGSWKTASEVAKAIGILNPGNPESQKVAIAVKKFNGNVGKRTNDGRLLLLPPVI